MVATPILLRTTPRIPTAPPRWTFSYTGTLYTASYTGASGLHTPSAGGMSDTDETTTESCFSLNGAGSLTASFGIAAYRITTVRTRPIDPAHPDGWSPVSTYTDGRVVQASIDGITWRTLGTTSGATFGSDSNISAGGIYARFIRIVNASGFFGLGRFSFT